MSDTLIVRARITRTGTLDYGDDKSPQRVHRSDGELFDPKSLSSLELCPIFERHDRTGDPIGWVTEPRRADPPYDNWIEAHLVITHEPTIARILSGELAEVSAGTLSTHKQTLDSDGAVDLMGNIRHDHLTLLPAGKARAGRDARILLHTAKKIERGKPVTPHEGLRRLKEADPSWRHCDVAEAHQMPSDDQLLTEFMGQVKL